MYQHWRGGTFIRIHRDDCRYSEGERQIDPNAEQTMYPDGSYETLAEAITAAEAKVPRYKACAICCEVKAPAE